MEKKIKKGLVFTNDNCIGCNRCISVCPVLTANMAVMDEDGGEQKIYVDGDSCITVVPALMSVNIMPVSMKMIPNVFLKTLRRASGFHSCWHQLFWQIIPESMRAFWEG